MKSIMHKLILFILLIYTKSLLAIDTKAQQAVVIDHDTNEILFEKNSNLKIIPASMTKIMTIFVVFDRLKNTNLSIEDKCVVSSKAYKMGGSRTFLEIDDYVTINDLLRGIIIQSGNDASVAIAECLAGTEDDFAKLMNVYALKMGMLNTNFKNSSGWPEIDHFSTAYDLALLSSFLIKNFPDLYYYFSEENFTYNDITQPNRNKLLYSVDGADGLKTGFTRKSGWGIAATALRNDRRIIVVISGTNSSRSRMNESSNLLNWAFNQTTQKTIVKENEIIKNVDVWLGSEPTVNLVVKQKFVSTLSFDQIQLLTSKITYTKPIAAPIIKGTEYGKLIIDIKGKPPIELPLVAQKDVSKINAFSRIFSAIKYLLFGNSLYEKK